MIKYVVMCLSLLMLFPGCADNHSNDQDGVELSSLYGNSFVLEVDRISEMPDVQFSSDDLQESDYEERDEGTAYNVTFSEDGQTIIIDQGSVHGQRTNNGFESLNYELGEGTFAGGRFIVWISNGGFEAELTIYGSGIPITKSERGYLYEQNN